MTAEITFPEEADPGAARPVLMPVIEAEPKDTNGKPKQKAKDKEDDEGGKAPTSAVIKQIRNAEDMSLKEMLDDLGTEGAFTVRITRKWPEYANDASGKRIQVSGFLTKVDKPIDEEWLQNTYGGGIYDLMIRKRDSKGKFGEAANRTITIAGEPNLNEMPRSAIPPAGSPPPPTGEPTPLVNKALELMSKQLDKAEERADRAGDRSHADHPMVELLREQLRSANERQEQLVARIEAMQARANEPTREEKFKDSLLDKLVDQDSARILAIRTQFESEIRQIKEAALANENRMHDRFERDRQDMRNAHERELTSIRLSYDMQINTLKSSHETALAAARASYETQSSSVKVGADNQKTILDAEIKRLERDNADLRDELKELRAKKEKTIVETVKELEIIKDAIGGGNDDADKSTTEKIIEAITNPEAIAAVGQMIGKGPQAAAPAAPPPERVARPRVVRDKETGKKFVVSADGKSMRPAVPPPIPGQPQLPSFEPETIEQVVGYLERAYTAGTDPDIVAQSAKASVPEPILMALREVGGVDVFLAKVAKLPSSSPLSATQAGRNWVKKVGKALLGE